MSKPSRETQLQRGERLLREWGIDPAAETSTGLRTAAGRDAAADLAIAAHLGRIAEPDSVAVLQSLEAASRDKLVHREVRRSLYRLAQRGVAVPAPAAPAPPPVAAAALEGYLSAVDGRGDQLVWLVRPRPGGLHHLFAVVNDPEGLLEISLFETSRKALRASREDLLRRHELRLIDADWRYCDFLMDRAYRWATERGRTVSGDYLGMRARVLTAPAGEMAPLIFGRVDATAVRATPHLLAESDRILEEAEFRTWVFDREALAPYLTEAQRVRESPLVLSGAQQQERVGEVAARAVEELFGGVRQASWVRRLEEMAYFFSCTGRPQQAERALAAALALDAGTRGGRDIPFCETLARSSLAAFLQAEEQRQEEQARTSLVLTPQQAAREAQRRRSGS